jgi:C-terminal peptidase prc
MKHFRSLTTRPLNCDGPAGKVLFLAALLASPAPAAVAPPVKAQAHIVLVGIDQYRDKGIRPRAHAEDDAKILFDLFCNTDYLGVDREHIRLLLGRPDRNRGSRPATRQNVLEALRWIADSARRDDLVIFAFFGQGASLGEAGNRTCYLASDSDLATRDRTAVADTDIGREVGRLRSKRLCVFLDVNFNGHDAAALRIPEFVVGNETYKEFFKDYDADAVAERAVFLSTRGETSGRDLDGHSLFASVLLRGLQGEADKVGSEPDGFVTVAELTDFLDNELAQLYRKHGKTAEEKAAPHLVLGARSRDLALTRNPAVIGRVQSRQKRLEALARKHQLDPQLLGEGLTLLGRMPRLEAQRKLRKEYQKLADGGPLEPFQKAREAIVAGRRLPRAHADRYVKSVMQAVNFAAQTHVKEVDRGEMVGWGVRGLFRRIAEEVPPTVARKLDGLKGGKEDALRDVLREVRETLGKREDLDRHRDIDHTLQTMLPRLDPYTIYNDPGSTSKPEDRLRRSYAGVGIQIQKDAATDGWVVLTPFKGSPAHRAGIKAGDRILTIVREFDSDGKPLKPVEKVSTIGLPLEGIQKRLLGRPGTLVKLLLQREGVKEPFEVELRRGVVEQESIVGVKRKIDDSWDFMLDEKHKIGYVRMNRFQGRTFVDLEAAMRDLEKQGMEGFIFDFRFNLGGLLTVAIETSDLFIDDGLIVSIKPRRPGNSRLHRGRSEGSLLDFPMVVLINHESASASEIVASCLQDHKRAIVMGERSFGKGSMQVVQPFDGGEILLTRALWFRPSGKNINKASTKGGEDDDWGVTPDRGYILTLSRKETRDLRDHLASQEIIHRQDMPAKRPRTVFKDRQLDLALTYLRNPAVQAEHRVLALVQAIGKRSAAHLYDAHQKIGLLADTRAGKPLDPGLHDYQLRLTLDTLPGIDRQLSGMLKMDLVSAEQKKLQTLRGILAREVRSAESLKSYWANQDPKYLELYRTARAEAWEELRELLGLEKSLSADGKYISKEGKFAMRFPPGTRITTFRREAAGLTTHSTFTRDRDVLYRVQYTDLPGAGRDAPPKDTLDAAVQRALKQERWRLIASKEFAFGVGNLPAREIVVAIEAPRIKGLTEERRKSLEGKGRIRFILFGGRLYEVLVQGPGDTTASKESEAILDSFEIAK